MATNFLDTTGLQHFYDKLMVVINKKADATAVEAVSGEVTTVKATLDTKAAAQDVTDLAGRVDGIDAELDTMATSETVGQIQTNLSNLASNVENNYALKTEITGIYKYKGSIDTFATLPTEGNEVGDVYNVVDKDGMNYAWTGDAWDALGESFVVDAISTDTIDALFADAEA